MVLNAKLHEYDAVLAIGDVHGQAKALEGVLKKCNSLWDRPYFIFLGDLVDGPDSVTVYKQVIRMVEGGECTVLASNHEADFQIYMSGSNVANPDRENVIAAIGRTRLRDFFRSLERYVIYQNNFLTHAPVYRYPDFKWISSESPEHFFLESFEQAILAGYDFAGTQAHGTFQQEELLYDPNYIGVCGHEELENVTVYRRHYICLDSGAAAGGNLSAFELRSKRLVQTDRNGLLVRNEVIDV